MTGALGGSARRCSLTAPLAMRMVPTCSVSTTSQESADAPTRWRPSRVGAVAAPVVVMRRSGSFPQGVVEGLGEVGEVGLGEGGFDVFDDLFDSLQGDGSLSEQLDDVGELFGEKKLGLAEVLLDSCDLDAAVLQAGDEVVDFVLVEVEVEAVEVFAETLASDLGVSIKSDQLLNGDGSDFDGVDELADGFVP